MTDTPQYWTTETDDNGVLWLCIDRPDTSANTLAGAVLMQLGDIINGLKDKPPTAIVMYSGKTNGFIMGADITEFSGLESAADASEAMRLGQGLFNELEALPCPSVAVINGFALGGGLEIAMACTYRLGIEQPKPVIGLPEVQLGLHPGFGGTVRAVQFAGVRAAMDLMLTGRSITISKARKIGLVDDTCKTDDWRDAAVKLAKSGRPRARAGLVDRLMNLAPVRPFVANMMRKQVARKARKDHYPAPYAIIDLWQRYGASPRNGYDAEADSMGKLMVGDTSRNLVRVFFLQNKLKSQGAKGTRKYQRVHVIGAGVMGGDIAAWCALRGFDVTLQDRAEEYIQPAIDRANRLFDKKTYNEPDRMAVGKRLRADVAGDGVADADLIIEAIFEDLDAKQALYKDVQARMKADAVLATNTSSIRLEELRTVLDAPTRFIGLHFFNPVAQLPLVELVRCDDTDQEVIDEGFGFIKGISKLGLECSSSPGFVVNRLLAPYMAEAMHLHEEGVSLRDIDKAAEDFGMPMGPVELVDTVGIDVAVGVSKVLGKAFDRPIPDGLLAMVEEGNLGRKSGQGFYRWEDGKAVKPEGGGNVPANIQERLILPLVNEAVACLQENVVTNADLLDAGVIFGTGFAPFRGGPLQYARERGIDKTRDELSQLAEKHGDRYQPHAGWDNLD